MYTSVCDYTDASFWRVFNENQKGILDLPEVACWPDI